MPSFTQVREELTAKREALHKLYEEAGPDLDMDKVVSLDGDSAYKAGEFKRRQDELTALGAQFDELHSLELIRANNEHEYRRLTQPFDGGRMVHPTGSANGKAGTNGYGGSGAGGSAFDQAPPRSLKQFLAEHKGYRAFQQANRGTVEFELPYADFKTLVTLATVSPQADRRELVELAYERRTVTDRFMQGTTDRPSVEYYEETTWTNAAAETAEGSAKPEDTWAVTLRTEPVRKIAHWIPATKEALDDNSFLESTLRNRMAQGVRRREELQVLVGDGIAPNIQGLVNRSGIQTQAKGADPIPDTVYKGMQLVRGSAGSGFAEPDLIILHPTDYTDIKLLRTTDGIYIYGNPGDEAPDRMWGLPVVQTTNLTAGTGLVLDTRFVEVLRREGITVTLSTEHSTYFTENKVAILGESRLALAVYRPSAVVTLTGI